MEAITQFFAYILGQFDKSNFALLAIIDCAAYLAVFVLALLACIFSAKVRSRDKRAFLYFTNLFAAVTLAVFLTDFSLTQSVAVAAVFWCIGYVLYGLLCLFNGKEQKPRASAPVQEVRTVTVNNSPRPAQAPATVRVDTDGQSASQNVVRLDHALSIADKLLLKNLGRGDRQELEKIKTALTVLKVRGILSAQEGESLNEMFNALLKLMAKYDL